ncbi:hypothetical protein ACTXT7_016449 [Hymenolepis weldensis]
MSSHLPFSVIEGKYEISTLPTGTVLDISKYLSLLDKINLCSAIPEWKWLLLTLRVQKEFQHRITEWTWADKRLCETVFKSQKPSVDDLCDMVRYQHSQTESFSKRRSQTGGTILRCLVLGPAVDRLGIMSGFYGNLVNLVDVQDERQVFSNPPGSISNGIPIRIASTTESGSNDILMDVLTLHARVKSRRAIETSRIHDSFIINEGNLSEKAYSMVKSSDIILYFVTTQTDQADWSEIRFELSRISQALSLNQTLFIIGVCDEDAESGNYFSTVIEIARNLNGADYDPLKQSNACWRIWVLKRRGFDCSNLAEIFQWASYDSTSTRDSITQNLSMFSFLYDLIISPFKRH